MTQIVAAAVPLASVAFVSISCVGCVDRLSYTLPSVVVWATYLIFYELKDSKPLIKETFLSEQILVFRVGDGVLATFLDGYISCFGFTSTALQRS
eukprot:scaffold244_cov200-Alexandrium_tamarense.AAC.16